jgi:leader peptidase (prepilin peptidase) / N-methyltransferase
VPGNHNGLKRFPELNRLHGLYKLKMTGVTDLSRWGVVAVGVFFAAVILTAAYQFGLTVRALINLPTMILLAVAAIVDIQRKVIPNWFTLPGLAWVLVTSTFLGWPRIADALLGALLCGGALLILAVVSRGGIGGGDVKLMAMVGASLGWRWGFGVLAFAQLAIAAVALCLFLAGRKGRKDSLAFGPFLAAFAILAILARPV